MNIYLEFQEQPETIEDVLKKLFSFRYSHLCYKSARTYHDKECTQLECEQDKFRSIDDTIDIVRTYFPNASDAEIITSIFLFTPLNDKGIKLHLRMINCRNISKPTLSYQFIYEQRIYSDILESKSLTNSRFKNWMEVCNVVGITSEKQLHELHK